MRWNSNERAGNSGSSGGRESAECDEETLKAVNCVQSSGEAGEPMGHSSRLGTRAGFHENPQQPDDRGTHNPGAIEQTNEFKGEVEHSAGTSISAETDFEESFAFADEVAEQPGEIDGDMIDLHRSIVNDAGDRVAGKEDVIVPHIAEAGLDGHWPRGPG